MGKKRLEDAQDLDLIPIMNMVTILIPMLLMSAQFVSLAVIDSTLPAISQADPTTEQPTEPPLTLSVMITPEGFTLAGQDTALTQPGPSGQPENKVPCKTPICASPDDYDYDALTAKIVPLKDRHEKDENVILIPSAKTPYEVLVRVMDATREDKNNKNDKGESRKLFPLVVIAGGVD